MHRKNNSKKSNRDDNASPWKDSKLSVVEEKIKSKEEHTTEAKQTFAISSCCKVILKSTPQTFR